MKNAEKLLGTSRYKISSRFGMRLNPKTKKEEFHNGVDYATYEKKVPCYTIDDGVVLRVDTDKFGGKFVYIKFTNLKKVGLYYHLDSVNVKVGQNLMLREQVGTVGNTGQSTGIHLHFSLIEDNERALLYYRANYLDYETYVS